MLRFEHDGSATLVAQSQTPWNPPPLGTRFTLEGENVVAWVHRTGQTARMDDWTNATGPVAALAHELGVSSAVATPIIVEGRLWGTMIAVTNQSEPLPADIESRIGEFTELVATAIANAQSRETLAQLADEQAALRRVAMLVAHDVTPSEIFSAVSDEVARVFDSAAGVLRFEHGSAVVFVGVANIDIPIGARWEFQEGMTSAEVYRTGRPARVEEVDLPSLEGDVGEVSRRHGTRSIVGSPILVEGRLWGTIVVSSRKDLLPLDTEERLERFTELIATAIANAATRQARAQLVEEQAALRRVATLVAEGAEPEAVFAKVAEETGRLLGGVECTLLRNDRDQGVTNVGTWGEISAAFPLGTRSFPSGDGVAATVLRTGHSHRIDDYSAVADPVARGARDRGIESSVGCPIVVRGAVWGAIVVGATGAEPFPPETELRLTQFADLVATAVANAEARAEIVRLAEEQAAQKRVATLVARGAQPIEIFSAVTDEVGRLFETDLAIVGRFQDDPPAVVAVAVGTKVEGIEVGSCWKLDGPEARSDVFRSPAVRADERVGRRSGAFADTMDSLGVASMVASPIIVDGRLWGAVIVPGTEQLPADTEARLEKFTDLVGIAIANADAKSELAASRRRIVAASDEARRGIERDLHDGTQQRLVSLALAARAAEAELPPRSRDVREKFSRIAAGLAAAVEELQELSRGIHPAILSDAGLGPALEALALRSPIPVELEVMTEKRFSEPVEVAVYFVASESLANAAKHSRSTRIDVALTVKNQGLLLSVCDDGIGGADPGRGSGLVGLRDRVEALGGSLEITSEPGVGTSLVAALPIRH